MSSRIISSFALAIAGMLIAACSDITNPSRALSPSAPSFSGGPATDPAGAPSSGGGGGGGGSTGVDTPCGTLTTGVQTTTILVYTYRTGIGFSGVATNCSLKTRETFDIAVVDQETDPVCRVYVPRFIAARNTSAGGTMPWAANSTLVNCPNRLHTFSVTLKDVTSGSILATSDASLFL